jgi:mRNA interferase RelE/StbE
MAGYEIHFKKSVYKELKSLSKADLKKILAKIKQLAEVPRPIDTQKLTGSELYRVRQGEYRIIYSIQDNELLIHVIKVGHRKDVYR